MRSRVAFKLERIARVLLFGSRTNAKEVCRHDLAPLVAYLTVLVVAFLVHGNARAHTILSVACRTTSR